MATAKGKAMSAKYGTAPRKDAPAKKSDRPMTPKERVDQAHGQFAPKPKAKPAPTPKAKPKAAKAKVKPVPSDVKPKAKPKKKLAAKFQANSARDRFVRD